MSLQSFAQHEPIFFSATQISHLLHHGSNNEKPPAILLLRRWQFDFVGPIKPLRVIDDMHFQP